MQPTSTTSTDQPMTWATGHEQRAHGALETWGQFLAGIFLITAGVRQRSFTGGVLASIGSCLAYRGAECLLYCPTDSRTQQFKHELPDPASVDNPVDEASWESFPASDSPFFSGITK